MHPVLESLCKSATDVTGLARSLAESGLESVMGMFKGCHLFGSLTVLATADAERDETHYLLVPTPGGCAVFTKRMLPPGIGTHNSLPKARVFHIPDASARESMERELVATLTQDALSAADTDSDIAAALERMADEIDRETLRISGGLLLIGGVVALANPLLGIGIAAKALLPSLGSKATRAGVDLIAGKLREWSQARAEAKAVKDAEEAVKRLQPEIFTNPILRALDTLVTRPDGDYDPFLDPHCWPDAFGQHRYYEVTAEAVREVYGELAKPGGDGTGPLQNWVRHLAAARSEGG